jgi:hypothetical protein
MSLAPISISIVNVDEGRNGRGQRVGVSVLSIS